jgi:hypothetical protein
MKNFYKKLLLFLVPILLVWFATEVFYRTAENNYTYKTQRIISEYNEIETLVFGDSHAFFGIDPEYFTSKTFNIANVSQSLYFDELLLKKHIDSIPKLKTVVLNISYFTLSVVDDSSEDRWRKYFYQQQMELEVPTISKCDPRKYSLALARRFDKSVDLFKEYLKNGTIVSTYENGFGMQDESNIVADKVAISKLISKKHEDNSVDFKVNVERLQQMIDICKKRDIEVILIEMPVYKTYYNLLDSNKKQKINETLLNLERNNSNVQFYDFSQEQSFKDNDLRDADHLTNEGAVKFSKLLNTIIEQ